MVRSSNSRAPRHLLRSLLIGTITAAMLTPLFGSAAVAVPETVTGYDAVQRVEFQYDKNNLAAGASYVKTTGVSDGHLVIPERVIDTNLAIPLELQITRLGSESHGYEDTFSRVVVPGSVESFDYRLFRRATVHELVLSEGITSVDARAFREVGLQKLSLPSTITTLGEEAFADNDLTELAVPASLSAIGGSAFARNQLQTLVLSDGLTHIGERMFESNQVTSIDLPDSISEIGSGSFANNFISSMVIGENVLQIGDQAFVNNSISTLTLTNPATSLGKMVFGFNNLHSLKLPEGITTIPANAFIGNALLELTLPESVTSIGTGAFALNELRELAFSDSLTTIEDSAFLGNKLNRVTFGTRIESIGPWTFGDNPSLNRVIFQGPPPAFIDPADSEGASLGTADGLVVLFPREFTELYLAYDRSTNHWQAYAASPSVLRVNYDTHGSGAIPSEDVEYGRLIGLPKSPKKHGAVFTGWFSDAQLTAKFDPAQPITADLTLHAGWKSVATPANGSDANGAQDTHNGLARTGGDPQSLPAIAIGAAALLAAGALFVTRDRLRAKVRR